MPIWRNQQLQLSTTTTIHLNSHLLLHNVGLLDGRQGRRWRRSPPDSRQPPRKPQPLVACSQTAKTATRQATPNPKRNIANQPSRRSNSPPSSSLTTSLPAALSTSPFRATTPQKQPAQQPSNPSRNE